LKKHVVVIIVLFAVLLTATAVAGCTGGRQAPEKSSKVENVSKEVSNDSIILATTTSTKDTGLLDALIPAFEKKYGITVKPIAAGTGEALKMGERGDADVLLVHSRAAEDEFMAEGFGTVRKDVMHNDFVIIGPRDDPAGIKGSASAADAFKRIAGKGAILVSRGDDSGTHKKELGIWEKANIKPEGDWYISTGQGMAATIRIANEKLGYTLSDRGTYLVQKDNIDLVVLTEKSDDLLNPYGVIAVNPDKHSKINYRGATKFIEFLTSEEGQEIIGEFGKDKFGQALFVPDASEAKLR